MSKKIKKIMNKPSLINEWNDISFKDLPKRWTGAYGRKDGLTEFEAMGGKDNIKLGKLYTDKDRPPFATNKQIEQLKLKEEYVVDEEGWKGVTGLVKGFFEDLRAVSGAIKEKSIKDLYNALDDIDGRQLQVKDVLKKHLKTEEGVVTEANTLPPFEIAKKILKHPLWKSHQSWAKEIIRKFRGRGVSQKALDKWLPDYIEGRAIAALFEGNVTEGLTRWKVFIKGESKPLILTGRNENDVKKLAHAMINNNSIKIARVVKEGIITEWKHNFPGFTAKEYETIQNWIDMGSLSQTIAMYKKNKKSFTQFIKDAS